VKILLLHAFPLDKRMWDPQRAALEGHELIAPRLYGRGKTMDAWAESVAGEIDGEVAVVGASMGGYCALAMARQSSRVRALLLAGSRADPDSDERRAGRADTIRLIREEGPDALWRDMRPKLYADETTADDNLLHRDPDMLVQAVEAIRDRDDSTAVARGFGPRLVFVVGEQDPFVSADELREYDVREIERAAHLPSLERPAQFGALLGELLARV
jgi:3-oxoadipate enol-lactonase